MKTTSLYSWELVASNRANLLTEGFSKTLSAHVEVMIYSGSIYFTNLLGTINLSANSSERLTDGLTECSVHNYTTYNL